MANNLSFTLVDFVPHSAPNGYPQKVSKTVPFQGPSNKYNLTNVTQYTSKKKCPAQECERRFVRMGDLKSHVVENHPEKLREFPHLLPSVILSCPHCSRVFARTASLTKHQCEGKTDSSNMFVQQNLYCSIAQNSNENSSSRPMQFGDNESSSSEENQTSNNLSSSPSHQKMDISFLVN